MWSYVNSFDHRGPEFTRIIEEAEADLKKLMSIPDNYKVLFLQGGASQQFSAIPFNLTQPDDVVDHVSASTTRYALLGAHDWEPCSCCTKQKVCRAVQSAHARKVMLIVYRQTCATL